MLVWLELLANSGCTSELSTQASEAKEQLEAAEQHNAQLRRKHESRVEEVRDHPHVVRLTGGPRCS